ncbi:MAG: insulinase family protein [Ignavibacteria bacterium]|nr:insulinase family protein [Ignavibacteria bacterium]
MLKYLILILMFTLSAQVKGQASNVEFEEFDMKNGLHVIMHKDNANPIVSVDIWYHVGAKDEDPGRTGFAHLFEHMMFQGSDNIGKSEHFNYVQKAGGTVNGTTSQDRTNYFESAPSNQLELLLWLESDRMQTLKVTQENFDNQREVVKEEKRMRYDNAPYGSRWGEMMKRAFKDETYEWIPIGSMEDLNNADLQYAQEFYRKYYSPDNAVLVISGDIDYDNARKLTEKYFSEIKPAETKKNAYPEITFNSGEIRDVIYDNVQLPAVYIGYKIPGMTNKEVRALEIISMIIGDGRSSRLYENIVYKKKTAKSSGSFVWDNEVGGLFIVYATGFKNTDLDSLTTDITGIIDQLSEGEVLEKEIQKAKNSIENDQVNSRQTILGKADALANYWTFFKNTAMINTIVDDYLGVTKDDILNAAKKYLSTSNRVVLYYEPKPENKVN